MNDYDEWRAEVLAMTETERAVNCGHTRINGKHDCPDCGFSPKEQA